jgi:hypothetical protein
LTKDPSDSITFPAFVLSLSTAAMQHLEKANQTKNGTALPLAKQTIDILAILKNKTEGNLSEEEAKLLGNVLYDLRMRYVKASG